MRIDELLVQFAIRAFQHILGHITGQAHASALRAVTAPETLFALVPAEQHTARDLCAVHLALELIFYLVVLRFQHMGIQSRTGSRDIRGYTEYAFIDDTRRKELEVRRRFQHVGHQHTMVRSHQVRQLRVVVSAQQPIVHIFVQMQRLVVLQLERTVVFHRACQHSVEIHLLYRHPSFLGQQLGALRVASHRIHIPVVRGLHRAHLIRRVVGRRDTTLAYPGNLESGIHRLIRRGSVDVLRQVAVVEHAGYMRFQTVCLHKIQIAFVGRLPEQIAGDSAAITLDVLCEVLRGTIEALVQQTVLVGGLLLPAGQT